MIGRVYRMFDGNANTMWSLCPNIAKRDCMAKQEGEWEKYSSSLCRQKGVELLEGHLMPDHIHMCLSVPPKFSIAFVIGFLKGKSAVRIHREVFKYQRVTGMHFWARGYCVSTVGLDEAAVKKYIRDQEKAEKQQLELELNI